jgi:hypothetical protein
MKKIILASSIILASANISAKQLNHYNDIKSAVTSGEKIQIVIDYSKCTLPNGDRVPFKYTSVFTPNEIAINEDKNYLTTSIFHFTLSHPAFPAQPVYEFSKYIIGSDDTLRFSVQPVDARSYAALKDMVSFDCKLGVSATAYSQI